MALSDGVHWLVKRYRATVINDIWLAVVFFSAWAAAIQLISVHVHDLSISNQILTVLGTVLGLVVSFRTSSAYERYQEGRKLWTSIQLASRNLGILIWIHGPNERPLRAGDDSDGPGRNRLAAVIEKKSMLNLVQAFSVSVKHLLRGEPGVYYADLYPLISFLPRYAAQPGASTSERLPVWHNYGMEIRQATPESSRAASPSRSQSRAHSRKNSAFDPEKALPQLSPQYELLPARSPPKTTIYDVLPFAIIFKPIVSLCTWIFLRRAHSADKDLTFTGKRRKPAHVDSNVPMELSLFLNSYFAVLLKAGIPPAVATGFSNALNSLQDSVANLERVRNTPLPFAYQAHLRMCMWLYLFLLPFQIRAAYGYLTIPATAFASFLLLGFLEIGQEIEDPFGYDLNDLDLDTICLAIARELHEISAHPAPDPSSYIFTEDNQPFAPADLTTAKDMVSGVGQNGYHEPDTGLGSIHRTLLRNWQQVNEYTRKK